MEFISWNFNNNPWEKLNFIKYSRRWNGNNGCKVELQDTSSDRDPFSLVHFICYTDLTTCLCSVVRMYVYACMRIKKETFHISKHRQQVLSNFLTCVWASTTIAALRVNTRIIELGWCLSNEYRSKCRRGSSSARWREGDL